MKKVFTVFAAVAAIVTVAFGTLAFTACNADADYFDDGAEMTLVIATEPVKEYKIDLTGKSKNVKVTELMDDEGIPYTMSGTFITSADGLFQSGNVYLYLYTSVEKDKSVDEWTTTMDYKGTTLTTAGVGILDLTVEDGCVIYICTVVYQF